MCSDFHEHLYDYIRHLADYGTINKEDLDLFLLTDSVEEMEAHIKRFAIEGYGLKRRHELTPAGILGERS
jgi:predicted Rossmann-fold nucleotide-binding protein